MAEPSDQAGRSIVLEVAYQGSGFHGFVAQENASPTVASELLRAVQRFDAEVQNLVVASRTDAGVHAHMQLTAFDTKRDLPPRAWVLGLQKQLPRSITIRQATVTSAGYNPRFNTAGKRYRYLLFCDKLQDPFFWQRAWHLRGMPNDGVARLNEELAAAHGQHDFAGFASARDPRKHTIRRMRRLLARPMEDDPRIVAIDIEGDHFLHNMVRILVGSAVEVALGRKEKGCIARALQSKRRIHAGMTAPAEGLYLKEIFLRNPVPGTSWPAATESAPRQAAGEMAED